MNGKIPAAIVSLLFCCAAASAQMSFQGLTPGSSTSSDVEKTLGKPVRTISSSEFEYKAPAGIAKVKVAYDSAVVQRISAYLLQPITRTALIQKFSLPQQPDAKLKENDKLLEVYGKQGMLGLLYESQDPASGIGCLIYYSPAMFERMIAPQRMALPSTSATMDRTGVPRPLPAQTAPPRTSEASTETAAITNDDVIGLVQAGLGDEVIIAKIKKASSTNFDTSVAGLKELKERRGFQRCDQANDRSKRCSGSIRNRPHIIWPSDQRSGQSADASRRVLRGGYRA